MQTTEDKTRQELTALQADVVTLSQLTTNKDRGQFLVARLQAKPALAKYWRAAASQAAFSDAMQARVLGPNLPPVVGAIVARTLCQTAGLPVAVLQRALAAAGLPTVEQPISDARATIRVSDAGPSARGEPTATAVLEFGGRRFGNAIIVLNDAGKRGLAALRAAGVLVEVPHWLGRYFDEDQG